MIVVVVSVLLIVVVAQLLSFLPYIDDGHWFPNHGMQ